jgi:hypothetical protein
MTSERPPPPQNNDILDEIWTCLTNTATDFTRSLVGLPMFYRHDPQAVKSIFAEPGILSPEIITFHLDHDIDNIIGPFRFETRPVSVFDIVYQGIMNPTRSGTGMMFSFHTSMENTWFLTPGLKSTENIMFYPWSDKWIRKSNSRFKMKIDISI